MTLWSQCLQQVTGFLVASQVPRPMIYWYVFVKMISSQLSMQKYRYCAPEKPGLFAVSTSVQKKKPSPNYITENANGDIIVSDWKKKNPIIVVDRLGIYRYSYMYLGIDSNFNVSSTACDSVVHIIVTYFGGDKIHMLDRQGISEEHHARGRNTNTMRCVYPWSR